MKLMRRAKAEPGRGATRRGWPAPLRRAWQIGYGVFVLVPILLLALYRFMPVPITPLMVHRLAAGDGLERHWVALADLPAAVPRAVIAAEDNLFCNHFGFDWNAIDRVLDEEEDGKPTRGGSTISQQTAKNLFLWPGRNYVRKGLEAYLTVLLELTLDKPRILTLYLNIAEWGPGVYGIEAAARHHFDKAASSLSASEAARLASILPSPRTWSAGQPSPRLARKAETVRRRMSQLAPYYACLPAGRTP